MIIRKKGTLITHNEKTDAEDETKVNIIILPKHHFRRGGFMLLSKDFANFIIKPNNRLNSSEYSLFFALCKRVESGNHIKPFTHKQLAIELQTSRPNISRSLKKLLELGIIQKIEMEYYFDDQYIWTGDKRE
jgi:predicted HTH transcriptional regulator